MRAVKRLSVLSSEFSPCIMCVQYIGGCHEYIGGYHEYIGGCFSTLGDIMMHVGGQVGKNLSISLEDPDVLNIPQCAEHPRRTHDIPLTYS